MDSTTPAAVPPRLFSFAGGAVGAWRVIGMGAVAGPPLATVSRVAVRAGAVHENVADEAPQDGGRQNQGRQNEGWQDQGWQLRGITSNERYVERTEKAALSRRQEGLGRAASTRAVLIPIRKSAVWWGLTQDERRAVFEAQSAHIGIGLRYLPAIARRLHHCRDLGADEPFDFLTWFEFAPADAPAFDALLAALRATPEWTYVEREVEIRLERDSA